MLLYQTVKSHPETKGVPMKQANPVVLAICASLGTLLGVFVVIHFDPLRTLVQEMPQKSTEVVEKPSSYVFRSGIERANVLCEKLGGILSLGNVMGVDGNKYYLDCIYGEKFAFEIKHAK